MRTISEYSYFGDPGRLWRIAIRIIFGSIFIELTRSSAFLSEILLSSFNYCFVLQMRRILLILRRISAYILPRSHICILKSFLVSHIHHWFLAEMLNILPMLFMRDRMKDHILLTVPTLLSIKTFFKDIKPIFYC